MGVVVMVVVHGLADELRQRAGDIHRDGEEDVGSHYLCPRGPVIRRHAAGRIRRLPGRVIGDVEPKRAHLANGPRGVGHVQPGGPEGAVRESVLDEGGHEGVPG